VEIHAPTDSKRTQLLGTNAKNSAISGVRHNLWVLI